MTWLRFQPGYDRGARGKQLGRAGGAGVWEGSREAWRGWSYRCALQVQPGVDRPAELGGVGRVGGVAGALQAAGKAWHGVQLVHHALVARAVADQAGVV